MIFENPTERMHELRIASDSYQPPQLLACRECHHLFQQAPPPDYRPGLLREHLIPAAMDTIACPGSLRPPLATAQPVTHYAIATRPNEPPQTLLPCCGRHPAHVPAWDSFTHDYHKATCPGSPQQSST